MRRTLINSCILICLSISQNVLAEVKVYDVEIVLFEDVRHEYINSEVWPTKSPINKLALKKEPNDPQIVQSLDSTLPSSIEDEMLVETSDNLELMPDELSNEANAPLFMTPEYPSANDVIYILPIENKLLIEEADKIKRSPEYKVLLHKSWRQAGLSEDSVIAIPVDSRNDPEEARDSKESELDPLADIETAHKKHRTDHLQNFIEGDIEVELSRYLHVYVDLNYKLLESQHINISKADIDDEIDIYSDYPFRSHRKLRSNELHYIDHPLVGMLIKIVPAEFPPEEEIETDINTAETITNVINQ